MKFTQADIDSIITAQENDNLTVFIGAGFSKFSETETIKFPSWGKLMIALNNDLNTQETDFLKIAQLYYLEFGEYKLYKKLREFVPLHAEPSDFHLQVFQLLKPKYVITTNWDNLLEKTVSNNGLFYDVMKTEADLIKSNLPKKLIKVHGSFDTHNIVFKEDDYLNYSINNPIFDNFLKHILS
ncbi:MAG: SIR2 family protein, partial [Neisseria subflava]